MDWETIDPICSLEIFQQTIQILNAFNTWI